MSHELDTHLSTLVSDRKRMQGVKFETPNYSPAAVAAFRELKLSNNHKVRELVTVYPGLVYVVDAVCTLGRRTRLCCIGRASAVISMWPSF